MPLLSIRLTFRNLNFIINAPFDRWENIKSTYIGKQSIEQLYRAGLFRICFLRVVANVQRSNTSDAAE